MRRFQATSRINVKKNATGEAYKIGLVRFPFSSREVCCVCFAGKFSAKIQEASFSQVGERLRKLLTIMTKQKSCTPNDFVA